MTSRIFRPLLAALCVVPLVLACQPAADSDAAPVQQAALPPGSDYDGPAFEFEEVAPGIYHARGTGALTVGSHGAVIVNDDDVILVDSHISPAAATAILSEVATLTDKPVKYVVNTHFHFDHAHGNQIYTSDVHVIGHEYTREMLEGGGSLDRVYDGFLGGLPDQIATLEGQLEAAESDDERARLEGQLRITRNFHAGQEGLDPTGPNTTLSDRMTLFRGDREIRLLFFGRGHTGGDVVVHLPGERILITGDLLLEGLPFMGNGFLADWDDTLEHLKDLEYDWILPGHGNPFQDKSRIDALQAYLRDLQSRAEALHAQGLTYEEAAEQIDMTDHAERYPQIQGRGVATIAMFRIFELLDPAEGEG